LPWHEMVGLALPARLLGSRLKCGTCIALGLCETEKWLPSSMFRSG
jgi:hypothetical protein